MADLRTQASAVAVRNGMVEFQFPDREEANRAVDLLRAEKCAIETIARTSSTLEEVFVRTVNAA